MQSGLSLYASERLGCYVLVGALYRHTALLAWVLKLMVTVWTDNFIPSVFE
jgi:hypothetical protein